MSPARTLALAAPLALLLLLAGCAEHLQRTMAVSTSCGGETGAPWLGCANRANLAAMVADPADLARGRELTPGSALRAARVIEAYEAPPVAHDDAKTETTR